MGKQTNNPIISIDTDTLQKQLLKTKQEKDAQKLKESIKPKDTIVNTPGSSDSAVGEFKYLPITPLMSVRNPNFQEPLSDFESKKEKKPEPTVTSYTPQYPRKAPPVDEQGNLIKRNYYDNLFDILDYVNLSNDDKDKLAIIADKTFSGEKLSEDEDKVAGEIIDNLVTSEKIKDEIANLIFDKEYKPTRYPSGFYEHLASQGDDITPENFEILQNYKIELQSQDRERQARLIKYGGTLGSAMNIGESALESTSQVLSTLFVVPDIIESTFNSEIFGRGENRLPGTKLSKINALQDKSVLGIGKFVEGDIEGGFNEALEWLKSDVGMMLAEFETFKGAGMAMSNVADSWFKAYPKIAKYVKNMPMLPVFKENIVGGEAAYTMKTSFAGLLAKMELWREAGNMVRNPDSEQGILFGLSPLKIAASATAGKLVGKLANIENLQKVLRNTWNVDDGMMLNILKNPKALLSFVNQTLGASAAFEMEGVVKRAIDIYNSKGEDEKIWDKTWSSLGESIAEIAEHPEEIINSLLVMGAMHAGSSMAAKKMLNFEAKQIELQKEYEKSLPDLSKAGDEIKDIEKTDSDVHSSEQTPQSESEKQAGSTPVQPAPFNADIEIVDNLSLSINKVEKSTNIIKDSQLIVDKLIEGGSADNVKSEETPEILQRMMDSNGNRLFSDNDIISMTESERLYYATGGRRGTLPTTLRMDLGMYDAIVEAAKFAGKVSDKIKVWVSGLTKTKGDRKIFGLDSSGLLADLTPEENLQIRAEIAKKIQQVESLPKTKDTEHNIAQLTTLFNKLSDTPKTDNLTPDEIKKFAQDMYQGKLNTPTQEQMENKTATDEQLRNVQILTNYTKEINEELVKIKGGTSLYSSLGVTPDDIKYAVQFGGELIKSGINKFHEWSAKMSEQFSDWKGIADNDKVLYWNNAVERNLLIGYRGQAPHEGYEHAKLQKSVGSGATEGEGYYIWRGNESISKESALDWADRHPESTFKIEYIQPKNPIIADALPILEESDILFEPISSKDSEWIRLNKQATINSGVTKDNYDRIKLNKELNRLLVEGGYDAVDAQLVSGEPYFTVILDESLIKNVSTLEKSPLGKIMSGEGKSQEVKSESSPVSQEILNGGHKILEPTNPDVNISELKSTDIPSMSQAESMTKPTGFRNISDMPITEVKVSDMMDGDTFIKDGTTYRVVGRNSEGVMVEGRGQEVWNPNRIIRIQGEVNPKEAYFNSDKKATPPTDITLGMNIGLGGAKDWEYATGLFKKAYDAMSDVWSRTKWDKSESERVWKETGWYYGKDGKWRFKISDEESSVNLDAANRNPESVLIDKDFMDLDKRLGDKNLSPSDRRNILQKMYDLENQSRFRTPELAEVLNHDKLYELYPQLKNIRVRFDDTGKWGGWWDRGIWEIVIDKNKSRDESRIHTVLLHEVQHAIQDIEGFSRGNNSDVAIQSLSQKDKDEITTDIRSMYNRYITTVSNKIKYAGKLSDSDKEVLNSFIHDYHQLSESSKNQSSDWYFSDANAMRLEKMRDIQESAVKRFDGLLPKRVVMNAFGWDNYLTDKNVISNNESLHRQYNNIVDAIDRKDYKQVDYYLNKLNPSLAFNIYMDTMGEQEARETDSGYKGAPFTQYKYKNSYIADNGGTNFSIDLSKKSSEGITLNASLVPGLENMIRDAEITIQNIGKFISNSSDNIRRWGRDEIQFRELPVADKVIRNAEKLARGIGTFDFLSKIDPNMYAIWTWIRDYMGESYNDTGVIWRDFDSQTWNRLDNQTKSNITRALGIAQELERHGRTKLSTILAQAKLNEVETNMFKSWWKAKETGLRTWKKNATRTMIQTLENMTETSQAEHVNKNADIVAKLNGDILKDEKILVQDGKIKLTPNQREQYAKAFQDERFAKWENNYIFPMSKTGDWATVITDPNKKDDSGNPEFVTMKFYKTKGDALRDLETYKATRPEMTFEIHDKHRVLKQYGERMSLWDLENLISELSINESDAQIEKLRGRLATDLVNRHSLERQHQLDVDWTPENAIEMFNNFTRVIAVSSKGYYMNEMKKHLPNIKNPEHRQFASEFIENQRRSSGDEWAAARGMISAYFLKGKISFWVANVLGRYTMIPATATNYLVKFGINSPFLTEKIFVKAEADALKYMLSLGKNFNSKRKGLKPEHVPNIDSMLFSDLEYLRDQGVISANMAEKLFGEERYSNGAPMSRTGRVWHMLSIPGEVSEKWNRVLSSVVAYDIAKRTKMTEEQRRKFMRQFSDETNGSYGAHNLPQMIAGAGKLKPLMRTIYIFQHFKNTWIQLQMQNMKTAIDKNEHGITARLVAGSMITGGVTGTFGWQLFRMLWNEMFAEEPETEARKWFEEQGVSPRLQNIILRGVPAGLPLTKDESGKFNGFDVSYQLGAGDYIPTRVDASSMIGAAWTFPKSVKYAYESIQRGNIENAIREVLPSALKGILQYADIEKAGGVLRTRDGNAIYKPDVVAKWMMVASLTPTDLALARLKTSTLKLAVSDRTTHVSVFNDRFVEAMLSKDYSRLEEILIDINEWNESRLKKNLSAYDLKKEWNFIVAGYKRAISTELRDEQLQEDVQRLALELNNLLRLNKKK